MALKQKHSNEIYTLKNNFHRKAQIYIILVNFYSLFPQRDTAWNEK